MDQANRSIWDDVCSMVELLSITRTGLDLPKRIEAETN